jgi:hypothetical protein
LWNGTFYMTGNAGNGTVKGLPQIVDNTGVHRESIFLRIISTDLMAASSIRLLEAI